MVYRRKISANAYTDVRVVSFNYAQCL